jgi:hypothetical protein
MESQAGVLANVKMLEIDKAGFAFQTQCHFDNHIIETLGVNLQQVDGTNVFLF